MAILLTGGTGNTALHTARLLQDAKTPFLLASRRGEDAAPSDMPAIKFDWLDSSTFEKPFQHKLPGGEKISAAYLVMPATADPAEPINKFIDIAFEDYGVKRFVLIGGSSTKLGDSRGGGVWQHLIDIGAEYCILRPTWFMDNFLDPMRHGATIKGPGQLYTSCGDGRIPFISVKDIGAMAFHTLTDEKPHNTDYHILGPELLTHDEVAAKLSNQLEREIVNVKVPVEERVQSMMKYGLPEHHATFLTSLETSTAGGSEDVMNDAVERVTGQAPQRFEDFMKEHQSAWK